MKKKIEILWADRQIERYQVIFDLGLALISGQKLVVQNSYLGPGPSISNRNMHRILTLDLGLSYLTGTCGTEFLPWTWA